MSFSFLRFAWYPAKLAATLPVPDMLRFTWAHLARQRLCRVTPRNCNCQAWVRPRTTDIRVLHAIFAERELSMAWPFASPPATIIDAGANVGYATLALRSRWPKSRVLAVEPDPANFSVLQRNVGEMSGVTPVQAGVWGQDGILEVLPNSVAAGAWGLRFEPVPAGSRTGIPAVSIPNLMQQLPDATCDLLKLDIEGAELSVFAQPDLSWIQRVRMILVETHGAEAEQRVEIAARRYGLTMATTGEKRVLRQNC